MESLYHVVSSGVNCCPSSSNNMSTSSESVCNILDLPDEILAKIILNFNARERLALTNICTTFNTLVFGDKELLRHLDFSEKRHLTTVANIQRYFSKKTVRKLVRKVNIENVKCLKAGPLLNSSIGRAINLVHVNIHGIEFKEVEELAIFLKPLVHLKRLSLDWPTSENIQYADCRQLLENPLSRLRYLSVRARANGGMIFPIVQQCRELEELRMVTTLPYYTINKKWSLEPNKLRNLKIVQFHGMEDTWTVKNTLINMIPDPCDWTDLYMANHESLVYLERNLEFCEELRPILSKMLDKNAIANIYYNESGCKIPYKGEKLWSVIPQYLLKEVITLTHENVSEDFNCLGFWGDSRLLKFEEAKRLLQDPGYHISYLNFIHGIQPVDDIHLVVSAFPNLTELNIGRISPRNKMTLNHTKAFKRRLRKRGSTAPEELNDPTNMDSPFKMLVENTPHLRSLTIFPQPAFSFTNQVNNIDLWDLDALYFIRGWINLRTINLTGIPIDDGSFLIDIRKGCPKLEEVGLWNLGIEKEFNYGKELCEMLKHCENLKDFAISQYFIDNISEVFTALSNNPKLERVRILTFAHKYNSLELISSIEQLLYQCPELTKIQFINPLWAGDIEKELNHALKRIVSELNRSNFVFDGPVLYDQESEDWKEFRSFRLAWNF